MKALHHAVARSHAHVPAPHRQTVSALSAKQLRELRAPPRVLEQYLAAEPSPALQAICRDVAKLEATTGDNNGVLAPRDLDHAPQLVRDLLEGVYAKEGGRKSLPLQRIDDRMREVAVKVLTRRGHPETPAYEHLYTALVKEALDWLGRGYREEVLEHGAKTYGEYFHSRGYDTESATPQWREAVRQVAPAPTPAQAFKLWQKVVDHEWTAKAFVEVAQMTVAEARALEASHPEAFARPASKATPGDVLPAGEDEAKALSKLLKSYLHDDAVATRDRLIERVNSDRAYVKQWGHLKESHYKTLQKKFPELFPDLRSVSVWMTPLADEVRALKVKNPAITQREAFEALKPRHPGLTGHHLEQLSAQTPGLFESKGRAGVANRTEQAAAVGAHFRRWAEQDVLMEREDLVARFNADKALVARWGPMTFELYRSLGHIPGANFPKLRDASVWMPVIGAKVKRLLADDPNLTYDQLTAALKPTHPRIAASRISDLLSAHPELRPKRQQLASQDEYPALAARVAALKQKHPKLTYDEIADRLKPEFSWVDRRKVEYAVANHMKAVAPELHAAYERAGDGARQTAVVQRLYELINHIFPPGTTQDVLLVALNRELERRGVPPFNSKVFQATRVSSLVVQAPVAARILAEYAAAAPKGAPEDQVLDALAKDYPGLDRFGLRFIRARWEKAPDFYPELKPFLGKHGFVFTGRGEHLKHPRYLGGWDIERAVLGVGGAEEKTLIGLSEDARIPLHLPMLDAALDELNGATPLMKTNVFMVSHFLASHVPLALALKDAGARFESTVMVGSPYGSNERVVQTLREFGFDLRVPHLEMADYEREVEKGLDAIVKKHRENGDPIVVLDDGGIVADLLHRKDKYKDVLDAFKIVEQTTGGILHTEQHALKVPIITAATSESKAREAEFIGEAVASKVVQGVVRLKKSVAGAHAVVMGYGKVGREVARQLREGGAHVTVVETSKTRRLQAKEAGFALGEPEAKLWEKTDLVIGTTGTQSVDLEAMKHLKSGATIASSSSKQVELDMQGLKAAASKSDTVEAEVPTLTLPTRRYRLGNRELTVLGDGWPVNFDGDVEDIRPEDIQLTRAIMFAGALQASRLRPGGKNVGLIPFKAADDQAILQRFAKLRKTPTGAHPSRDPGDWKQVIRDIAAETLTAVDAPASKA